jgi:hypothetical protein
VLCFVVMFSAGLAFHQEGQTEKAMGAFGVRSVARMHMLYAHGSLSLGEARRALTAHAHACVCAPLQNIMSDRAVVMRGGSQKEVASEVGWWEVARIPTVPWLTRCGQCVL